MPAITSTSLPESYQKDYTTVGRPFRIGDRIGIDSANDKVIPGNIPVRATQPQISRVTAVANDTDAVGLQIDGGDFSVTSPATDPALAQAEADRLNGAALLDGFLSAAVDTNDVVITFVDDDPHTVTSISPAVADFTILANDQEAVANERLLVGMFVVRAAEGRAYIARPSALGQRVVAVVLRKPAQIKPDDQARIAGFDPLFLQPGDAFDAVAEGSGRVAFVGAVPSLASGPIDVFAIKTGSNAGLATGSSGAVSQVTQGDVEFSGVEVVGLAVDSLPDLTVPSNTSDDQTATDLRDAWNGSAQHSAVAAATIDLSGAESFIILSFVDDQVHTVVAVSPATADVVAITNTTAAVAANAELVPNAVIDADFGGGEVRIVVNLVA